MGRVQTQAQQWILAVVGDDVRSAPYLVTYKGTDLNRSEAPHVAFSWKEALSSSTSLRSSIFKFEETVFKQSCGPFAFHELLG